MNEPPRPSALIEIATVDFSIGVAPLGELALRREATTLFEAWERRLSDEIPLPDYAVYFELEEGSLNGRGKIAAAAFAVYIAIGQFGSFMSGVRELSAIGRKSGDFLIEEAQSLVPPRANVSMRTRKTAGGVGQLERLFERVRLREIEPAEAAAQARLLFEGEPNISPELLRAIEAELIRAPRNAEQLTFGLITGFDDSPYKESDGQRSKRQRTKGPTPSVPPPERYRVEIWRESRKGRRRLTVEHL